MLAELEKYLILNSNRLRTSEDARLRVEAQFCLRIRDSKPSEPGARGYSDPMDVDAINSLTSGTGKGAREGCLKCGGKHFQRDCLLYSRHTTQRQWQERHTEQVMHGSRVLTHERAKKLKEMGISKDTPRFQECQRFVQKRHRRIALANLALSMLGLMMAGGLTNGMMTGTRLLARMLGGPSVNSTGSFSLGSFDLGAVSSPKRLEWVKMNLDTGVQ